MNTYLDLTVKTKQDRINEFKSLSKYEQKMKKLSNESITSDVHSKAYFELIIFLFIRAYFNKYGNNEYSLCHNTLADFWDVHRNTIGSWCNELEELGIITKIKNINAGQVYKYKENGIEIERKRALYKKIKIDKVIVENGVERHILGYVSIYSIDTGKIIDYIKKTLDIDLVENAFKYKRIVNDFYKYVYGLYANELQLDISELNEDVYDALDKKQIDKLKGKIKENQLYLSKKDKLDNSFPEFTCAYLKEGKLRLYHEICSTVNPEHTEKFVENSYYRSSTSRIKMLESLMKTDYNNLVEYDTNGSIYRLTYNMNNNTLLKHDVDIYELIWNNCKFTPFKELEDVIDIRNDFKKILMPIYMRPYSIANKAYNLACLYYKKYTIDKNNKIIDNPDWLYVEQSDKDLFDLYEKLFILTKTRNNRRSYERFLITIRDAMIKTFNITDTNIKDTYRSDIFIHESNLHILIREKFLEKGIKCVNVYDGFYFNKNDVTITDFYKIYDESVQELKNNYSRRTI